MSLSFHNADSRRQLGESLATFVCSFSSSASGSNSLIGVIADLVADDPDMGPPLRDLVTRPIFLNLLPSAAKGGEGVLAQRDSLLAELSRTYKPDVISAVGDVLNGFLNIKNGAGISGNESCGDVVPSRPSKSNLTSQDSICNNSSKSDLECLVDLLASKEWHEADRLTWKILLNSTGSEFNYIPEDAWSHVPIDLIQEIDVMWSVGSSFRYGFSVQKAIWSELLIQMSRRESAESIELSVDPVDAFSSFIRPNDARQTISKTGFFPGYGVCARWNPLRNQLNVQESRSGLISSFDLFYEKLRSCKSSFDDVSLDPSTLSLIELHVKSLPFRPIENNVTASIVQEASSSLATKSGTSGCLGSFLVLWALSAIGVVAAIFAGDSFSEDPLQKLDSLQTTLDQAVLICEIKPLLKQVQSISTKGYEEAAIRKKVMIAKAQKRIAYLDADGQYGYREYGGCTYGRQYFDDSKSLNGLDQERVFVAVSRKCVDPDLVVKFSLAEDGDYVPRLKYVKSISGHVTGSLDFPRPDLPSDVKYWWNASVVCN